MCDCIQEADKALAEYNTKIEVPWIGPQRPFVLTMKLNEKKRGKPQMMFCSYCPFCGEKYPETKPLFSAPQDIITGGGNG
jgi:hypothetical protein